VEKLYSSITNAINWMCPTVIVDPGCDPFMIDLIQGIPDARIPNAGQKTQNPGLP
jgi:hypothetical protein